MPSYECYVSYPTQCDPYPKKLNRENTLFYPEARMSIQAQHTSGRPLRYHVVTNSPDLVGLYDREEVWIYSKEEKRWVHPDFQTYACDLSRIRQLFGIQAAIPRACLDGKTTNVMGHPVKRRVKRRPHKAVP